MKRIIYGFWILLTIPMFLSCGGGKKSNQPSTQDSLQAAIKKNLKHFEVLDLNKFSYQLSIMVPDSTIGVLQVVHKNNGSIAINVGKAFGINISVGDAGDLSLLKSDLKGDLVYKSTILQSDSNSITYKRVIPGTNIKPQVQFLYSVKIGNSIYDVKSQQMEVFGEAAVKKMLMAAHTLKAKKATKEDNSQGSV